MFLILCHPQATCLVYHVFFQKSTTFFNFFNFFLSSCSNHHFLKISKHTCVINVLHLFSFFDNLAPIWSIAFIFYHSLIRRWFFLKNIKASVQNTHDKRRRRDLNPRAAINDLLPFQGSPFSLLGTSPVFS